LTGIYRPNEGEILVDGQDLEQRRFAGAVLADQRSDRAGMQRDAEIVERLHARKDLGDAEHFKNGGRITGFAVRGGLLKG
ncbi:hypothetical protein ACC735_39590, partial [Rhizobium ruizarguesonis]